MKTASFEQVGFLTSVISVNAGIRKTRWQLKPKSSISENFEYLGYIKRVFLGSVTLRAIGNEAWVSGVAAH